MSAKKTTDTTLTFAPNIVVAHRGAWKKNKLPENSIASLREAVRIGCTGSEFDVHLTADDSLVVNHDAHYAGLTIEESTYAELSATKLPNGEMLPTVY
ncbi:MAG TPA: glycerophosphodiester phosphodiesterase family protein, partial [Agriterribacter sp.]|nr:glycerophosphodiester phosphodiesterase family protein [Agriterribacter sp.]